jgi:hypothetical protein
MKRIWLPTELKENPMQQKGGLSKLKRARKRRKRRKMKKMKMKKKMMMNKLVLAQLFPVYKAFNSPVNNSFLLKNLPQICVRLVFKLYVSFFV